MKRRDFVAGLAGAAAWPVVARAQQAVMPIVGVLSARSAAANMTLVSAFTSGLNEAGYREGRNVKLEYRWAEGHYDRLPQLAADLVRQQVTVIAAISGTPTALAARAATATIPIVFATGGDPVRSGLVASLNEPSGNITGVSFFTASLAAKRLELLRELVPSGATVGFLINPSNPIASAEIADAENAARSLGFRLLMLRTVEKPDYNAVFATLSKQNASALVVGSDATLPITELMELALRHAMPVMSGRREATELGGLLSYGAKQPEAFYNAGLYVGKILSGAKPSELPVQLPTTFELVINLKTAKAFGLTIPPTLLARADAVIE